MAKLNVFDEFWREAATERPPPTDEELLARIFEAIDRLPIELPRFYLRNEWAETLLIVGKLVQRHKELKDGKRRLGAGIWMERFMRLTRDLTQHLKACPPEAWSLLNEAIDERDREWRAEQERLRTENNERRRRLGLDEVEWSHGYSKVPALNDLAGHLQHYSLATSLAEVGRTNGATPGGTVEPLVCWQISSWPSVMRHVRQNARDAFEDLTALRAARRVNPITNKEYGPFFEFFAELFRIYDIDLSPAAEIRKLWRKRA
jgi:hypothetical protein